tara:strand:- start:58 stop:237 length:180 start_codon:yes stop_codon:yes gene_type:complete
MLTAFAFIVALQLDEYYCRLSSFGEGMCVYQCQNGFERFTWIEFEKQNGCKLMKKVYKA